MINIEEIAKTMTKEEFIKIKFKESRCPQSLRLKDITEGSFCSKACYTCWSKAVKGIKFKDDLEVI